MISVEEYWPDWGGMWMPVTSPGSFYLPAATSSGYTFDFKVPWDYMPAVPGRYIALKSRGTDMMWWESDSDNNNTHLQIVGWDTVRAMASVSGTISHTGHKPGEPIFVQAIDTQGNILVSTMITEPGPYTLEGIGLGWQGYIFAFTPYYGFNIFEWDADIIHARREVQANQANTNGVDLVC